MAPKAVTAYFVFTEENRAAVQQELNAAAAAAAAAAAEQQAAEGDAGGGADAGAAPNKPAAKVSVAVVAKELGARWRALPDSERDRYKELAKQRAEAAAAAAEAAAGAGAGADGDAAAGGGGADQHAAAAGDGEAAEEADSNAGPALPRGVVKRVMAADPEFKRATADAVWLISAAVEALLGLVAERAARQAVGKRRRTVKLEDLAHVIKYDKRLAEAGLRDVVEDNAMYEAAAAAAAAKAAAKGPPKPRAAAAAGGGGGAEAGGSPEGGGGGGTKGPRSRKAATEDRAQRSISAFFKTS